MTMHKKKYMTMCMVLISFGLTTSGCFDLPSVSEIENFRVLAMNADPPEIAPGDGTRLEILWADPEGQGRKVSFAWMGCSGLIHSSEGLSTCDMLIPPTVGTAEEGFDVMEIPATPENLMDYDIMGVGKVKATIIVLMCAGGELPEPDEYASLKDVENVNTLCEGGEGISVYKTVTISESDNPQRNPALERMTANGKPVDNGEDAEPFQVRCKNNTDCGVEVKLEAFFAKGSVQSYEVTEFDEPVTKKERLSTAWFVTGGSVDWERSGAAGDNPLGPFETEWSPEAPGTYTVYVVGHDDRGGAGWQSYVFEVLP